MTRRRALSIAFEALVKTYGATAALRGVSGRVPAGSLTLVEGANGSGKSTLLRILGTVVKPTSGSVSYEGFGTDRFAVRAHLGWVSHDPLAYGDLTGRQNVEFAAAGHGLDVVEAWDRCRERFQLGRFSERPLRTNSRGQKQRVALARALVHEPSLVLLDEPTTGLDTSGIDRLMGVVEDECQGGAALVVVTHEASTFASLAEQRISLHRGRRTD
ncbi:MAG: ABC transporter ATP-binding protein [Myxococcota bacterium]